ncbi:hypothetical protein HWV62_20688 [Athelia sp. TMB]|nr:hypothetical protein HWV62_20688 [Athelia sp. TMB]
MALRCIDSLFKVRPKQRARSDPRSYLFFSFREQEPLLRAKQQASPASGSSMLKLYIALFVAAVLICNFVGLVLWDRSCQNKNLVQYEKEVASRKAQEAQRELEWVREMDKKREEEHARETQWQTEYDLKKAQEARRELAWERHMNETQESERTREAQWKRAYDLKRAQEKQQERAWERQMDNKRREERTREAQWEMSQEKRERLGLSWSAPLSHGCVSHGVQSYRARLLDAVFTECLGSPTTANAKGMWVFSGSSCALNTDKTTTMPQEIWGHWTVEEDPSCSPFFQDWRTNVRVDILSNW